MLGNEPWWALDDEYQRANAVIATVQTIKSNEPARQERALRYMRLYGGREAVGMTPYGWAFTGTGGNGLWDDDRIRLNIIQSIIDTLTAKIGKNRPKPMYITDSGNWNARQACKDLDAWTEGTFYGARIYDKMPMIFRDAAVFGTGVLHVYREHNIICAERVVPTELLVDLTDAIYAEPRAMYRVKLVDSQVLKATFPKYAEFIEENATVIESASPNIDANTKKIEVVEAWHLPSGPGAGDGRHTICINGAQLNEGADEWTRDEFPFVFFNWSSPLYGFWGTGAAERLTSIQIEINTLLQRIQEAFRLLSAPTVYVEEGSKVVKQHLTNEIGKIVSYRGTQPFVMTPQTVHPEVFAHLRFLIERGYFQEGASEMSAGGKKPLGIDSGRGMRVLSDIETDRFSTLSRSFETAHMNIARLMIAEAREALANGESLKGTVMSRNRRGARTVSFEDIKISEDEYVMQVFPVSSLSSEPGARMEDIQELIAVGMISQEIGMRLLDFPDLDYESSIVFAPVDYIDWRVSKILDDGEDGYEDPTPYQNIDLTISRVSRIIQREQINGCPEDRLQLLEQYLGAALKMKQDALAQAAAAAAQAQQAMAPQQAQPAPQAMPANAALPQGVMA